MVTHKEGEIKQLAYQRRASIDNGGYTARNREESATEDVKRGGYSGDLCSTNYASILWLLIACFLDISPSLDGGTARRAGRLHGQRGTEERRERKTGREKDPWHRAGGT